MFWKIETSKIATALSESERFSTFTNRFSSSSPHLQAAPPEPADPDQRRGEQLHRRPPSARHGQVQL